MGLQQEMRAYEEAQRQLLSVGICSKTAIMVLFAMLEEDKDYPEACRSYAKFSGVSETEVKRELEDAVRHKGLYLPARAVIERLYCQALGVDYRYCNGLGCSSGEN